jgi:hypothetical protein
MVVQIDSAYRYSGSNHENLICLILAPGLLLLVAGTFFPSLINMTGTFQIYDDSIFQAKDGDAAVRRSPVHHETLIGLQILQQGLNLTDGHMARIQTVVDEETEAVRFGNAVLQQENAAFEHIVNRTELRGTFQLSQLSHFIYNPPKDDYAVGL